MIIWESRSEVIKISRNLFDQKFSPFFTFFHEQKRVFQTLWSGPTSTFAKSDIFEVFLDPLKKVRTFCHVGEVSNIQKIMNFKKNTFFHCFKNIYYSGFQFFNFWKLWKYEFRHRSVDRFSRKPWFSVDETFRFVKNRLLGAHQMKSFLWFFSESNIRNAWTADR